MTKTLSFLSALALVSACSTEMTDPTGAPLGKADSLAATDSTVVFRNQIACVTAPCPVFTVIDPTGALHQVADVVLPDASDAELDALHTAGLAVEGEIVAGSWEPGQPGDVLVVDAVVAPLGSAAPVLVGGSWTVIGAGGARAVVSQIDVSALQLPADSADSLLADMRDGKLLVGGYVRSKPAKLGGAVLTFVVTTASEIVADYTITSAGIKCVTTPCPSFELTDADGNTMLVDEIGLAGLGLSDADVTALHEQLIDGTLSVRGFVSEVDLAIVFQVTKLL